MAIEDIKQTAPLGAYGQDKHHGGAFYHRPQPSQDDPKGHGDDDQAFEETLHIPLEELTPSVRAVLGKLKQESDDLRAQLSVARKLDHDLAAQMDQRQDLPSLTHHALLREVRKIIAHVQRTELASSFAYIRIHNLAALRHLHGLSAGYSVMAQVGEMLNARLRATDHVGSLAGDGFGLILALSPEAEARAVCEKFCQDVESQSFNTEGQALQVEVTFGLYEILGMETVQHVMDAAYEKGIGLEQKATQ